MIVVLIKFVYNEYMYVSNYGYVLVLYVLLLVLYVGVFVFNFIMLIRCVLMEG